MRLVGLGLPLVLLLSASCEEPSQKWKDAECILGDPDKPPCPQGTACAEDFRCHATCKESSSECESPIEACFLPNGVCKVYSATCDPANPSCMEGFYCAASGACTKKLGMGSRCSDADECWSAVCQDGYCCTACIETCSACAEELTGRPSGTCAHVLEGLDPHDSCAGALACRGGGNCYEPNGAACNDSYECASGHCVDGYCCNDGCDGTCVACAGTRTGEADGTCSPIPRFGDPEGECLSAGGYGCTGTDPGTCKTVIKIVAPDAEANDAFGFSVAISGDYAIVGAVRKDGGDGNTPDAGAAYVYHRIGVDTWDQGTKLVAPDAGEDDGFGIAVAISGDYAIVGAYLATGGSSDTPVHGAGAAYVFRRMGENSWDSGTKLVAPVAYGGDWFGSSVAINADYAIVGAQLSDYDGYVEFAGAAYVFHRTDANTWDTGSKLDAPTGHVQRHAFFGNSVAISGDCPIVGAYGEDGGSDNTPFSGAAYVFHRRDVNTWVAEAKFVAPDALDGTRFGWTVSISGDFAIVGADLGGGAAYVFRHTDGAWDAGTRLLAPDDQANTYFGGVVAIGGDYAIVGGATNDGDGDNTYRGAAYVLHRTGETWNGGTRLRPPNSQPGDGFNRSVAISGEHVIVGAPGVDVEDGSGQVLTDAGAAYIF